MRQILFYISLDHPFGFLPNGTPNSPLLTIGFGIIMLIVFAGYAAWYLLGPASKAPRITEEGEKDSPKEALQMLAIQCVVIGAIAFFFSPIRVFPVFGYGMMLLIAFVTGATWASKRGKEVGVSKDIIWDVAMWILMSGIIGARLFYLVQKRDQVFAGVQGIGDFFFRVVNLTDGGLVFYGGMILATITYFLFCSLYKVRPIYLADVVVPSVFLGLGFGRIGCLLNGCCYGDRCDLPWAITFPYDSVPHRALHMLGYLDANTPFTFGLHPSQIYSSIGGFLLAAVTATVFKYRRRVGEVLAVGAILYPINRFLIEFVRGDEFTVLNTGLTPSQNVSIGVAIAAVGFLIWLEMRGLPVSAEYEPDSNSGMAAGKPA